MCVFSSSFACTVGGCFCDSITTRRNPAVFGAYHHQGAGEDLRNQNDTPRAYCEIPYVARVRGLFLCLFVREGEYVGGYDLVRVVRKETDVHVYFVV